MRRFTADPLAGYGKYLSNPTFSLQVWFRDISDSFGLAIHNLSIRPFLARWRAFPPPIPQVRKS